MLQEIPAELMSDDEKDAMMLKDVFNVVNYGVHYEDKEQLVQFIEYHVQIMKAMKAKGTPVDSALWFGMMRVLTKLDGQVVIEEAKEQRPEGYLWTNIITK